MSTNEGDSSAIPDEKLNLKLRDDVIEQKHFIRRWNKTLFLTGLLTTIGNAVICGYNIGVINAPAQILKDWINDTYIARHDMPLSENTIDLIWSFVVSVFLIGGAVGSFAASFIANRYGRRGSYLICSFLFMIGSIAFYTCRMTSSFELLILGRILVGFASGLCTAVLPMYLSEIAPLDLRGNLGVFCSIGVTSGVVLGQIFSLPQIFGNEESWHLCLSFQFIFVVLCTAPFSYYPESPKYIQFAYRDRSRVLRELLKLCDSQEMAEYEFEQMMKDTDVQNQSLKSVLTNSKLMLALILCMVMQGGQQLSGINAIFYYSVSIFETIGLAPNTAKWANLGCGCLNLFVAFFTPYLMEKVNRRPLMLISCTFCSIFLAFLSVFYIYSSVLWFLPALCIVALFGYIIFYQIGLGPIPYFSGSELFEVDTRAVGMGMGSLSSWFFNFVIGMTFPILQRNIGATVFLIFAAVCALLACFLNKYMPETRGKDISEIAKKVSLGFRSRPTIDATDGDQ